MAVLSKRVHTFGRAILARHGERVHRIALDAGFTCPNRDGSKGTGGCTFCNNKPFHPQGAGRGCPREGEATVVKPTSRQQPRSKNAAPRDTPSDKASATTLARREDPDTLFFSRRLVSEGDIELGLIVKNLLDAIAPKVLRQLPTPLARAAQRLMAALKFESANRGALLKRIVGWSDIGHFLTFTHHERMSDCAVKAAPSNPIKWDSAWGQDEAELRSLVLRSLGAMIIDRVRATQLPINMYIWNFLPRQLFPPRL